MRPNKYKRTKRGEDRVDKERKKEGSEQGLEKVVIEQVGGVQGRGT